MLKGVPSILSPELLKILMEMGHGDDLVLADGNFPAASMGKRLVRCDGHNNVPLLDAILQFFPLDSFVERPVSLMAVVPGHDYKPTIWDAYRETVKRHESTFTDFEYIERFDFYARAKNAYAVITTSEMALYGCVILKKGILTA